jgi:hypothetical protein
VFYQDRFLATSQTPRFIFEICKLLIFSRFKRVDKNSIDIRSIWSDSFSTSHLPSGDHEAAAHVLLGRYGVVFRDLLQRETLIPRWRELQLVFRRMEDRGEVRGGRFVSGFVGEQFALPLAVDSLRAIRKMEPSGKIISLSAADPLNLVGIIVPGECIPALSRNAVTFRDGIPQASTEFKTT